MARPKTDSIFIGARVPQSVANALNELCLKQHWIYGSGKPKRSALLTKIAQGKEITIDGEKFFIFPLDTDN